jgi:hypothetical protein
MNDYYYPLGFADPLFKLDVDIIFTRMKIEQLSHAVNNWGDDDDYVALLIAELDLGILKCQRALL